MAHPQIAAFARLAQGNIPPTRAIAGQAALLSRSLHDIRYDAINDEILVANGHAQAILVYRGAADGEEAPIRIIQGSKTMLNDPDRLDVDPIHNEIFVPDREGKQILVFPRNGIGDVAPIRVLKGPATQLERAGALVVDPVHNLLVVGLPYSDTGSSPPAGSLLIFQRTDAGNTPPSRIIRGPKTGIIRINQMAVYSPRKVVIAAQPGKIEEMEPDGAFVGVWSLDDNGDVPPRWKLIAGPKSTMKKPRGVALDPKNKTVIIADMRLNAVLTFYFPEIF
ncbi:MAG: hypothetical protein HYX72_09625 [Acidobacteria bacterium]|nr:hypothetical protein [Acidobacteriota bacterium]